MEADANHASPCAGFPPRRAETIFSPAMSVAVRQDRCSPAGCVGQRQAKRLSSLDADTPARLRLPQSDRRTVVSRPGEPQQISLALPGPKRQDEGKPQRSGGDCKKAGNVGIAPDALASISPIPSSTSLARITGELAAGASLSKRDPDPWTGFDECDDVRLASIWPPQDGERRLYPVINAALNMAATTHLECRPCIRR
jgi:hypothetical protein